jgi:hypothetical protein
VQINTSFFLFFLVLQGSKFPKFYRTPPTLIKKKGQTPKKKKPKPKQKEGCICLRPVLNTPACLSLIVTPYKYLGLVKKKKKKSECELIPKGVLLIA